MSTVAEIEKAIIQLPPEQWLEIRNWMDAHQPAVDLVPKPVDWTRSAAVNRERADETRIPAQVVMDALAELRR